VAGINVRNYCAETKICLPEDVCCAFIGLSCAVLGHGANGAAAQLGRRIFGPATPPPWRNIVPCVDVPSYWQSAQGQQFSLQVVWCLSGCSIIPVAYIIQLDNRER